MLRFGRPGVDCHVRHDSDTAVLQLMFLVNEVRIIDVKFASGIKNIQLGCTQTLISVLALCILPSSVKKIIGILLGWDSNSRPLPF